MDTNELDYYLDMENENAMEMDEVGQEWETPQPKSDLALVTPSKSSIILNEESNFTKPQLEMEHLTKSRFSKTPRDFAMEMQAERRSALGDEYDGNSSGKMNKGGASARRTAIVEVESDMLTTKVGFPSCIDSDQYLHLRPPQASAFHSEYYSCTLGNGQKMYLHRRKIVLESDLRTRPTSGSAGLLTKSMSVLMKEADEIRVKKATSLHEQFDRSNRTVNEGAGSMSLWVEKYAPKHFTQLLSPEKINREVLRAIKRWDAFVFKKGEHVNAPGDPENADPRPRNKVILLCGPPGTGKTTLAHVVARHCGYSTIEINASDDRSPEVIRDLIYAATQNATLSFDAPSEDAESNANSARNKPNCIVLDECDGMDGSRNAIDLILNIIKAPLKSAAASGSNGAPTAAKPSKGSSVSNFALTRPLICICNDQYAPVLKELRKLAEIFVFNAPNEMQLISRLQQVCKQEQLQVNNTGMLSELCNATGYDIRASINHLQFAALKTKSSLASGAAPSSSSSATTATTDIGNTLHSMIHSGLKDDPLDLAQIWRNMFIAVAASDPSAKEGPVFKVDHGVKCMESVLAHGDSFQVVGGIFENVHSMEVLDPHISKHSLISDWISCADQFQGLMPVLRDGFQLAPYVGTVGAAVYTHFAVHSASRGRVKVQWPKQDREAHFKHIQRQGILQALYDGGQINSIITQKQRLVMDALPSLMDILAPPPAVRALPFITLSSPEQHAILSTVAAMESCGISYTYSRVVTVEANKPGGNFPNKFGWKNNNQNSLPYQSHGNTSSHTILKIEPAIDELFTYSLERCPELMMRHREVSPEMRQLLYTEQRKFSIQVKAHRMALEDGTTSVPSNKMTNSSSTAPAAAPAPAAGTSTGKKNTPFEIMQQQIAAKSAAAAAGGAGAKRSLAGGGSGLDGFFTRSGPSGASMKKAKAETPANVQTAAVETKTADATVQHKVKFRFNQGFSNAVKRIVTIEDFL